MAATQPMTVVGRHCESGDEIARDVPLPSDLRAGDFLAVGCTSAHHHSMASTYNMVGRPPLVAVTDGRSRELVRRETIADLLSRDPVYAKPIPRRRTPVESAIGASDVVTVGAVVVGMTQGRSSFGVDANFGVSTGVTVTESFAPTTLSVTEATPDIKGPAPLPTENRVYPDDDGGPR